MDHTTFISQGKAAALLQSRIAEDAGEWVYCPVCRHKTRIKIRKDTVLRNFPLYCPKCGNISLINAKNFQIAVID